MPVIRSVDNKSAAERAGLRVGDDLLSVGGHAVTDVLDLMFYTYDAQVSVEVKRLRANASCSCDSCRELLTFDIRKNEGEPLGVGFDTYLIDEPRGCRNKCVFCFIDQLPKSMRDTLYFKDDDARLSFLQGNYVSLTNMSDDDARRICDMRISPINVSVHTTNPELRCTMLGNRFAGEKLRYLNEFAKARVEINAQIVLCPGLNDGAELERTLNDLAALGISSCSVVPVGLTRFRDSLYPLTAVDRDAALIAIDAVDAMWERCIVERGSRVFYCADELFFTAGLQVPDTDYYNDFPQLENGVGMTALFRDEFMEALADIPSDTAAPPFICATGTLFAPVLTEMLDCLCEKCHNINGCVYAIRNDFFGETVTVAGLVTGNDLITQLRGKPLGERLFIPQAMLRSGEDVFLDDVTVGDVERNLGVKVIAVRDAVELLNSITHPVAPAVRHPSREGN